MQKQNVSIVALFLVGLITTAAGFVSAGTSAASVVDRSKMREVNGSVNPQDRFLNFRPWVAEQHNTVGKIENVYLHHLSDDAIHASGQSTDRLTASGDPLTFSTLLIRNVEVSNIWIPTGSGKHSDAMQFMGASQLTKNGRTLKLPNLVIENAYIHDTGSGTMTCLVQGWWDTITLRNVKTDRVYSDIKLGNARQILIENSPNLNVGIYGAPGTTGSVIVRNSAGATVQNRVYNGQQPSAPIHWTSGNVSTPNSPGTAVPEPGTLSLLALAGLGAMLRRRAA